MAHWQWIASRIVRKIWFRAALISLTGVLLAALSGVFARYVPIAYPGNLGQDAVDSILEIIASSMLAVTTFSLTAMVSAYGSATQLATPRATQLMIGDPTSQNALSTFLGAFVFSVVGIIGLQTGIYGEQGRIILFAGTVGLVALLVVTLLRWVAHITAFGRMSDVIDRVETAATRAMRDFARDARMGGRRAVAIPPDARALCARATGYVTYVDVAALGRLARQHGIVLHVSAIPGVMAHPARALLYIEHTQGACDDRLVDELLDAFTIERHRSFDHDPRLGLIALSEIASRALSPATNDPGTAIEVMNALLRVILLLPAQEPDGEDSDRRPPVHVSRPSVRDMLEDGFRPMLREGCGEIEVALRLDQTLAAVHDALPHTRTVIAEYARRVGRTAERRLDDPDMCAEFARAHTETWRTRGV